jgi:hypothetical protein
MFRLTLKKVLIACGVVALLFVLLCIGLALAVNLLMKRFAVTTIRERTGLDVTIKELDFKPWSGVLRVTDLEFFQPATNGGTMVLKIPELYVALDQKAAERNELRFRELRVSLSEGDFPSELPNGKTLEDLQAEWPKGPTNQPPLTFGGIDKLTLTLGKFSFPDPENPDQIRSLNFNIRNQVFTNVTTTNLESIIYFIGIKAAAGMLLEEAGKDKLR